MAELAALRAAALAENSRHEQQLLQLKERLTAVEQREMLLQQQEELLAKDRLLFVEECKTERAELARQWQQLRDEITRMEELTDVQKVMLWQCLPRWAEANSLRHCLRRWCVLWVVCSIDDGVFLVGGVLSRRWIWERQQVGNCWLSADVPIVISMNIVFTLLAVVCVLFNCVSNFIVRRLFVVVCATYFGNNINTVIDMCSTVKSVVTSQSLVFFGTWFLSLKMSFFILHSEMLSTCSNVKKICDIC